MAVGVTSPDGYRASGVAAGIKPSGRPDVALIVSDTAAAAGGVFTRSRTAACAVTLCRDALAASGGRARAVLVTSGNANAATGEQGASHAAAMAARVAALCHTDPEQVLVCSTGVIGVPLPIERVLRGIDAAHAALATDGAAAAAEAILTTDSSTKTASRSGHGFQIGAIAKGAAMIRPDLGTMLAILTTDAVVTPALLQSALRQACDASFNRISVDGATSTSDSVIALANGRSCVTPGAEELAELLTEVCLELALAIVHDGEGALRVGRYHVAGARSDADAERAARGVGEDQLVRCALHGADPNWGRIVAALGVCGVEVDPQRLAISIGGVPVVRHGVAVDGARPAAERAASVGEVTVTIDLGTGGDGTGYLYASDLSPAYVTLNAAVTT